jgi:hypothetical protein
MSYKAQRCEKGSTVVYFIDPNVQLAYNEALVKYYDLCKQGKRYDEETLSLRKNIRMLIEDPRFEKGDCNPITLQERLNEIKLLRRTL